MGLFKPVLFYKPIIAVGGDPDANAFISAAGITDPTQQSAIQTLTTSLKSAGLWTKMRAIYPFVGGTASSHKYNLKDPRDLDAAFRLDIPAGYTNDSTGMTANDTDLADTHFVANSEYANSNSNSIGFYSPNTPSSDQNISMGANLTGGGWVVDNEPYQLPSNTFVGRAFREILTGVTTSNVGLTTVTRLTQTDLKIYYDTTSVASNTTSETAGYMPTVSCTIGGLNGGSQRSDQTYQFAFIGDGLSSTEVSDLYDAVLTYQQTVRYDSDAQAFFDAAGITDGTEQIAVNNLVLDFKNDGLWSKMGAIYPFVGGTATTHKYNLKDPRDLDAAFRLDFNGGWTHSSTGATPNGSTGYADTHFKELTQNDTSFGVYSRTQIAAGSGVIIGYRFNASAHGSHIFPRFSGDLYKSRCQDDEAAGNDVSGQTNTQGFYFLSRTSSTTYNAVFDTTQNSITKTSVSGGINSYSHYLAARNNQGTAGNFNSCEQAFAFCGDGLTSGEQTSLYNAVQAFQTTLGREV